MLGEKILVFSAFFGVLLLIPVIAKWVISKGDETRAKTAKAKGLRKQKKVDINKDMLSWSKWIMGLAIFLLLLAGLDLLSYRQGSYIHQYLAIQNFGEALLLGIFSLLLWKRKIL